MFLPKIHNFAFRSVPKTIQTVVDLQNKEKKFKSGQ